ncbi:fibroblast growth factor receptor substrate 2-like isoform X2 [Homarus americanus]|uniref:fibroblast growth factor receptor substrate 2-like isoform X2 n=1 Tax=Homarus americanus TaxID=6706 RepID=UPI001C48DBD3|nr:fibroblast growth factor receptor substrate 2-like isoform X2 [Homarus americanus]
MSGGVQGAQHHPHVSHSFKYLQGARMGCVASKPDINDLHANIFQVVNVDDLGHRFSAAKLEVTDTDLVLHQRGKSAIHWPLRCLRRYGFDAELFSFESGRRCPTGPGIYAFKCRRAEALFNMLQLQIQNITEDAASRDIAALPPQVVNENRDLTHDDSRNSGTAGATDIEGYLEPVQRPHPRVSNNKGATSIGVPTGSSVSGVNSVVGSGSVSGGGMSYGGATGVVVGGGLGTIRSPASPPAQLSPTRHSCYENTYDITRTEETPPTPGHNMREPPPTPTEPLRPVFVNHIDKTVSYDHSVRPASYSDRSTSQLNSTQSKRPRSYVNINSSKPHYDVNTNDLVYVNVGPERHHDHNHVYVNLGQEKDVPAVPPRSSLAAGSAGSGSSHSGTTTTTDTDHQPSQINYIILDLDPGSDSSQAAPVSPLGSVASGPESPHHLAEGYATIDFDKTAALLDTAMAASAWEDGSRKTRHNSTFTNPATLTRHNSSLSD